MTTMALSPYRPQPPEARRPGVVPTRALPPGARQPGVPQPGVRLPRLLAGIGARPAGLEHHDRFYGPMPGRGRGRGRPRRLIDVVEASGLTGRGGAGFPAGRKMRSVAAGPGSKVVVANGAEGEPASLKDRLLLTRLPHLVLDGIALAAEAVGANESYLCVHGNQEMLLDSLHDAVEERQAAGRDPVRIRVAGLPGRYVSSEQSSIAHYLNGGPGIPTFSPPRPHERGVNGSPTLVHNVETLAHLALIARYGDRWFRGAGLPSAPGSMLVTVSGAVAWPVPMTHAGLKAAGGAMGAGIVIALPASCCPLAETARVVRYLAEETASQCGPCMFGLPALADALGHLAYSGGRNGAIDRITALIPVIEGRGACRHPDGATQLVRSVLRAFPADARWHERRGACAGVARPPLLPLPDDEERDWDFR